MSVRAKFTCSQKTVADNGLAQISFHPVYGGSEENTKFFNATPGGSISLGTLNPEAAEQFVQGKDYYVDFTPAG